MLPNENQLFKTHHRFSNNTQSDVVEECCRRFISNLSHLLWIRNIHFLRVINFSFLKRFETRKLIRCFIIIIIRFLGWFLTPGDRLNIKMSSYQYRDSRVKDKTVSPTVLSLTWESPYLEKAIKQHQHLNGRQPPEALMSPPISDPGVDVMIKLIPLIRSSITLPE